MTKFKKDYKLKIISLAVTISFLLNSTAYGVSLSKESYLRVNMIGNSKYAQERLKEALETISNNVKYKIATDEDMPKIIELFVRCDHEFVPPLSTREGFQGFEKDIQERMKKGRIFILFAPGTEKVICVHSLNIDSDQKGLYVYWRTIIIDPDYRHKRISKELIELPLKIREEIFPGITRIKAKTWKGSPSETLFSKRGFKLIEVIKGERGLDKEGKPIDTLWFELEVPNLISVNRETYTNL